MRRFALLLFGGVAIVAFLFVRLPSKSSAEEPEIPLLLVYWDTEFGGRCLEVTGDLLDLPKGVAEDGTEYDWNDQISSVVVVRGTWRLCEHGRGNTVVLEDVEVPTSGWSCLVSATSQGATKYAAPESGGWANDRVSSIQLVSGENLPDWAVSIR